jgi:enamine deaminase RidA (YjgF/YER057c/UK114 family)
MKIHNPATVHEPSAYSHAIELPPGARVVYISGQVGAAPDGSFAADFSAQAEQALKNLGAVLASAGMGVTDLVKVNSYLVRRQDLDAYRAIRSRFYGGHRPASTLLLISGLAREGGLIEIEAVAAKAQG